MEAKTWQYKAYCFGPWQLPCSFGEGHTSARASRYKGVYSIIVITAYYNILSYIIVYCSTLFTANFGNSYQGNAQYAVYQNSDGAFSLLTGDAMQRCTTHLPYIPI